MLRSLPSVIAVVLLGATAWAQTPSSPLFAAFSQTNYLSETYTDRPREGASYVHFEGEPITFLITIGNPQNEVEHLRLSPLAGGSLFHITSTRNGAPSSIQFDLSEGVSAFAGEPSAVADTSLPVRLRQSERVEWRIDVLDSLAPGNYQVSVDASGTDSQGRRLIWQTRSVPFEVRQRSSDSRAEITYREAIRHYLSDEPEHLERAAARAQALLRLHPQSYAAHALLGRIARDKGNAAGAQKYFDAAGDIIENDRDSLLKKFKMSYQIEEMKKSVRAQRSKKPQ